MVRQLTDTRQKRTIAALFRNGLKTVAMSVWYLWHHDLHSIIALFCNGLKTVARSFWYLGHYDFDYLFLQFNLFAGRDFRNL